MPSVPVKPPAAALSTAAAEAFLEDVDVLFPAERIQQRVQELARAISLTYRDQPLVVVPILRGSLMFATDLLRYMSIYPEVEFINASSYGNATMSSGHVQLFWPPHMDLKGKNVLIVEDIVDSGRTLRHIAQECGALEPASMRYAALLYKDRGPDSWPVEWFGFAIPDVFVVGYGLDYRQRFRNLPYIGQIPSNARP